MQSTISPEGTEAIQIRGAGRIKLSGPTADRVMTGDGKSQAIMGDEPTVAAGSILKAGLGRRVIVFEFYGLILCRHGAHVHEPPSMAV